MRKVNNEEGHGWAEIGSTLQDIDDVHIDHCKEDIDTLLVFVCRFVFYSATILSRA